MEQEYDEYGCAFMSKYVSEENGWTLTPDAWFDMVINLFIRNFPILKVHTPNTTIHISTTRAVHERLCCPELFSTVAYLEMKRVRKLLSEGRRIFRNLMDLPPLDNIEVASNNAQVDPMDIIQVDDSSVTSDNLSFEALDNTTSDDVEDSSNTASNEVLDNLASDSMSLNNSGKVALDNLASDSMDHTSNDGVLETSTNIQADILHTDASTNIQASLDILHADASDNMQSSSDNMQSSSDDMASDSLHGTSDNMASDTMTSDNMVQIKDETNLHKGKLIWVGRNMQTPSRIRVVPTVRIGMAKKKLIWNCPNRRTGTQKFLPILGQYHPLESFNCNCLLGIRGGKHINSLQSLDDAIHWSPSTVRELGHLVAPTGGEQVADACSGGAKEKIPPKAPSEPTSKIPPLDRGTRGGWKCRRKFSEKSSPERNGRRLA
ncbi:uncharacterized protein TNCV_3136211 [Trichonephila clavipes]|nr:uncharacterized protein TNCV_3136211 [Trichonephila clavipes]